MTQGSCMLEPPVVSYVEYLCRHVSSLQQYKNNVHIHTHIYYFNVASQVTSEV